MESIRLFACEDVNLLSEIINTANFSFIIWLVKIKTRYHNSHLSSVCRSASACLRLWQRTIIMHRSRVRLQTRWLQFFNWLNPSCLTTALAFTEPLTERSNRNLHAAKSAAGAYGQQSHRHLWAKCLENEISSYRPITFGIQ
jgi:hypothetical protein